MAHNGRYALEKRRKAEDVCRSMESRIAEDKRALQIASFETTSKVKIDHKMRQERRKELTGENDKILMNRRQHLADLYNDEIDCWRSEVMAKVETQEDRKARIVERAYALRDAREEERQKFVQEKYDAQWREACDGVRTLDSKALTVHMSKERVQQIQDKIVRKQQLNNDEHLIMIEWNKQLDHAQQQEDNKKAKQHKADMDTAIGLKNQMASNFAKKDEEYQRMQRDADEELTDIRNAMRKEAEKMKRRHDDAYARGREIFEDNQQFRLLEAEEAKIQRYHDKILLEYALVREREADQADDYKKQLTKQAAVQYNSYLKEQAIKEAEETSFLDDVRRREEEKVWKARDDVLQVRQDARDYLARMVDDGRKDQIRSKYEQAIREKAESQLFNSKFAKDAKEGIEKERADSIRRRNIEMENNDKLQDQIAFRKEKEEMQRQEAYLADKRMQYIERTHQQRLADQGGALRTKFPLKSGQWYS